MTKNVSRETHMQPALALPEPTCADHIEAARRRLAKRGGHEPADHGLFSQDSLQTDLVERTTSAMPTYDVSWTITVQADSPLAAARQVADWMDDNFTPHDDAFDVVDLSDRNNRVQVDLADHPTFDCTQPRCCKCGEVGPDCACRPVAA